MLIQHTVNHAKSDTWMITLLRTILVVKKSSSELSDIDPSSAVISWPSNTTPLRFNEWQYMNAMFSAKQAISRVKWCTFHWFGVFYNEFSYLILESATWQSETMKICLQNIPCSLLKNECDYYWWKNKHVTYVITVSDTAGYRQQSDMLS